MVAPRTHQHVRHVRTVVLSTLPRCLIHEDCTGAATSPEFLVHFIDRTCVSASDALPPLRWCHHILTNQHSLSLFDMLCTTTNPSHTSTPQHILNKQHHVPQSSTSLHQASTHTQTHNNHARNRASFPPTNTQSPSKTSV
jgi:hypothetical protein